MTYDSRPDTLIHSQRVGELAGASQPVIRVLVAVLLAGAATSACADQTWPAEPLGERPTVTVTVPAGPSCAAPGAVATVRPDGSAVLCDLR